MNMISSAPEIEFSLFPEQFWTTFMLGSLRQDLLSESENRAYNEAHIGSGSSKTRNADIRSDSTSWIDFKQASTTLNTLFEQLMETLNRETFYGLRSYEAHFARYQRGQSYDWHRDTLSGPRLEFRRISFVCYLHSEWQPGYGGQLEFADGTVIDPIPGRAVLFDSEKILHRVRESHFDRRSLCGWFRSGGV